MHLLICTSVKTNLLSSSAPHVLCVCVLQSAVAYKADGSEYVVDLVPLYKGLADIRASELYDEWEFWKEFQTYVNFPHIHERGQRHVKKALAAHWFKIDGTDMPGHDDDERDDEVAAASSVSGQLLVAIVCTFTTCTCSSHPLSTNPPIQPDRLLTLNVHAFLCDVCLYSD
jgi:hypothetical protein